MFLYEIEGASAVIRIMQQLMIGRPLRKCDEAITSCSQLATSSSSSLLSLVSVSIGGWSSTDDIRSLLSLMHMRSDVTAAAMTGLYELCTIGLQTTPHLDAMNDYAAMLMSKEE